MPGIARRRWGIPAVADPVLNVAFQMTRPPLALLSVPAIGDRVNRWPLGPDGFALVENARMLQKQQKQAVPTPELAA
ncbi:hypothetical protein [Smaragdicoccus niigatensis]|uniref:hypothetical protein n=1 Tax=Smaragdicoccus niigatensis TaxID=359359 RepID=UPI00138AC715|nr:hypothetical protein [Smaragdicoccus niigatensis]